MQNDLESFAAGNIPSGSSLGVFSFSYALGNVSLRLVDTIPTTSGTKALGTDDPVLKLQDGDDINFGFSPRTGFGLYVVSTDALLDGDIRLTVSGMPVSLVSAATQINLGAGGLAWFLGIQSNDSSTFSSASITTHGGGGAFRYTLDDLVSTTAVPEPNSFCLIAIGLAISFHSRRRSRDCSRCKPIC